MMTLTPAQRENAQRFGFRFGPGGGHTSRTIMLDELESLFSSFEHGTARRPEYRKAIVEENCLVKRSVENRRLTYKHLVDLFSLNTDEALFRALLFFWERDPRSHALLALLCALARDPLLRQATPFILSFTEGTVISREMVEDHMKAQNPHRFSSATIKSMAQNINASLTKTGHLMGRSRKNRSRATATTATVAYALFLGYLLGYRGKDLFQSEFANVLEGSYEQLLLLAEDAARRGWIVCQRVEEMLHIKFPALLTAEEGELLRG
ncbi:MAG TPA: hypothetical protein PK393_02280 [Synergistaceae bacterium]|nr:hypothetical protein [Synergistaceae bacterium]